MFKWVDQISKGMIVRDNTGRELGPVTAHEKDALIIDGGKKLEYIADYRRIDGIREGAVWLKPREGAPASTSTGAARGTSEGRDIDIDVLEEELDIRKRMKQSGEVTIHKGVTEETRQVTVPVVHEEIRVERRPASSGEVRAAGLGDKAFKEETISVPVMEEEVEIHKRPVVKERLHVSKERQVEQRATSETVRTEHVEVEQPTRQAPRPDDDKGTWK
ncbi:MAG: DUF2382 domain-containing protein [Myxococcota bacterium]|nr:DUF2382 domain-containing protein [Myxococcota bacterium]